MCCKTFYIEGGFIPSADFSSRWQSHSQATCIYRQQTFILSSISIVLVFQSINSKLLYVNQIRHQITSISDRIRLQAVTRSSASIILSVRLVTLYQCHNLLSTRSTALYSWISISEHVRHAVQNSTVIPHPAVCPAPLFTRLPERPTRTTYRLKFNLVHFGALEKRSHGK